LLIQETWENGTENYILGDSGLYEPFTEDIGRLFGSLQKECGRCIGKVYIDLFNKKKELTDTKAVGWIFERISHYEDTGEKYLHKTWVTLHNDKPTVKTKNHYHYL